MDRSDLGPAFKRAFQVGPTAALLVPEADIVALTLAARETTFAATPSYGPNCNVPKGLLDDLDKTSEPFADMLDLPFSEASARRERLVQSAEIVRNWLDAGCLTIPPVYHIRSLMEAVA